MAHGLRKTLQIVSFLHFGRLALQFQIVRNQNLVLFFFKYFDGIRRGLGIAYTTLRMLVLLHVHVYDILIIIFQGWSHISTKSASKKVARYIALFANTLRCKENRF
jgi:hypothetical protein